MPLTFAHPAVILPFSRNSKYINFLALVLGSMSPDFEYFLRGKPYGGIGHTFEGFVVLNLPIVLIVYLLYSTYVHRTLFTHLPTVLQDTYSTKPNSTNLLKGIVFLYSALFGMLTHIVWDSFTHLNGFMVKNFSMLSNTIQVFDYNLPVFKILQHGGTLVGLFAILLYMYIRTARYGRNEKATTSPKQKVIYWISIALLSMLLFCLWYLSSPVSITLYGAIVVRLIDSVLISLLLVSLCFDYFNKHK